MSTRSLRVAIALLLSSGTALASTPNARWQPPAAAQVDWAAVKERTAKYEAAKARHDALTQSNPFEASIRPLVNRAAERSGGPPSFLARLGCPTAPEGWERGEYRRAASEVDAALGNLSLSASRLRRQLEAVRESVKGTPSEKEICSRIDQQTKSLESRLTEARKLGYAVSAGLANRNGDWGERFNHWRQQLFWSDSETDLQRLREKLNAWEDSRASILGADLTYVQGGGQPAPLPSGSVVPAYASAGTSSLALEDTTLNREVSLTDDVKAKAVELGSAVKAYDWVKNEVQLDWYYGSMKDSAQVLRSKRGNDADIASLLIALLRAQGTPARYVNGTIRLPVERVADLMGLLTAGQVDSYYAHPETFALPEQTRTLVLKALSASGVPYEPESRGGHISSVKLAHIWIEAYVPYADYRGTGSSTEAKQWVAIDPAISGGAKYAATEPLFDALSAMSTDAEAISTRYLQAPTDLTPLEFVRSEVQSWLAQHRPDVTYAQLLRKVERRAEHLPALPGSLPYEVVSANAEYAFLPEKLQQKARIRASDSTGSLVDMTLPLHRLVGHRSVFTYIPATSADADLLASSGGPNQAPASAIRLNVVVRTDGTRAAESSRSIGMGLEHDWSVEVLPLNGTNRLIQNRVIAGNLVALGFGGPGNSYLPSSDVDMREDGAAASFLYERTAAYSNRWTDAESEFAALLGVLPIRPTTNVVFVQNKLAVERVAGVPSRVRFQGVEIDADLRMMTPLELQADRGGMLLRLAGLHGSSLEAAVLAESTGEHAVASTQIIQEARALGVDVLSITSSNASATLPLLVASTEVLNDIQEHLSQGRDVLIPSHDLVIEDWTGTGYITRNPATSEAGYFLSGRISGGTTVRSPNGWTDSALAETLQSWYAPTSTDNVQRVARIIKVPSSDFQQSTVGTFLPQPLTVIVTTIEGIPVRGARVDFMPFGQTNPKFSPVSSGQGLSPGGSNPVDGQDWTLTDSNGRASIRVQTDTKINERWAIEVKASPNNQLYGFNEVQAQVSNGVNDIVLSMPFTALGAPDSPATVVYRGRSEFVNFPDLASGNTLFNASVTDKYGNTLANQEIVWSSTGHGKFTPLGASTDYGAYRDAPNLRDSVSAVTPTLGEVGAQYVPYSEDSMRTVTVSMSSAGAVPATVQVTVGAAPIRWLGILGGPSDLLVSNGITGTASEKVVTVRVMGYTPSSTGGPSPTPVPLVQGSSVIHPAIWFDGSLGNVTVNNIRFVMKVTDQAGNELYAEEQMSGTYAAGAASFHVKYVAENSNQISNFYAIVSFFDESGVEVTVPVPFLDYVQSYSGKPTISTLDEKWPLAGSGVSGCPVSPHDGVSGFSIRNPASYPIYARVNYTPASPFDPQPSKIEDGFGLFAKPGDPTLWIIQPGLTRVRVYVPPNSRGGTDKVDVLAPDKDSLTQVATQKIEIAGTVENGSGESGGQAGVQTVTIRMPPEGAVVYSDVPDVIKKPLSSMPLPDLLCGTLESDDADDPPASQDRYCFAGNPDKPLPKTPPGEPTENPPNPGDPPPPTKSLSRRSVGTRYSVPAQVYLCGSGARHFELKIGTQTVSSGWVDVDPDGTQHLTAFPDSRITPQLTADGQIVVTIPPQDGPSKPISYSSTDSNGKKTTVDGNVSTSYRDMGALLVGHTYVKDVDVSQGTLVKQATDISVPARGLPLTLSRTYSSRTTDDGALGIGWTHSYNSYVIPEHLDTAGQQNCVYQERYLVIGGDGSGQTFSCEQDKECVSRVGYHGVFKDQSRNEDGKQIAEYMFKSVNGTEYHYRDANTNYSPPRVMLSSIRDRFGNELQIERGGENIDFGVLRVSDASKLRALVFSYEGKMIVSVDLVSLVPVPKLPDAPASDPVQYVSRPLGVTVTYGYSGKALTSVTRSEAGDAVRSESYTYLKNKDPSKPNRMVKHVDANGGATEYQYVDESATTPGETDYLKLESKENRSLRVSQVIEWTDHPTDASGQPAELKAEVTRFSYAIDVNAVPGAMGFSPPVGGFSTLVVGPRPDEPGTIYSMGVDGAVKEVWRPLNDAPRAVGENGPAKPNQVDYAITRSIWGLDKKKVKEVDPLGRVTAFDYDDRGNMTEKRILPLPRVDSREPTLFDGNKVPADTGVIVERWQYEPYFGTPICHIDPDGRVTRNTVSPTTGVILASRIYRDRVASGDVSTCVDCLTLASRVQPSDDDVVAGYGYCGINVPSASCGRNGRRGDPSYVQDGRGNKTQFADFDQYGNALLTLLPGSAPSSTAAVGVFSTFDARSRLTERQESRVVAAVGAEVPEMDPSAQSYHHSKMRYDGLDQLIEQRSLDSSGHSPDVVKYFSYYPGGQLKTETNGLGLTRTTTLDKRNRPSVITESGGLASPLTTTIRYDEDGNVIETVDRRGVKKVTTYDYLGRALQVSVNAAPGYSGGSGAVGIGNVVAEFKYDKAGNKVSEKDLHGFETTFVYDSLYRVMKKDLPPVRGVDGSPANYSVRCFYDFAGNKTVENDGNGHESRWAYDSASRLTETRDAFDRIARREYDRGGNVAREYTGHSVIIDNDERLDLFDDKNVTFDARNRPTVLTETVHGSVSATYTTTTSYDDRLHTVSVTNANGKTTRTSLDGMDHVYELVVDTAALALTTTFAYDGNGNRVQTTDALGRTVTENYDGLNRLLDRSFQPADVQESFSYDGEGQEISRTDRRGIVRKTTYDLLGRPLQKVLVESLSNNGAPLVQASIVYSDTPDSLGRVRVSTSDARGSISTSSSLQDALGREVELEDPEHHRIQSFYDAVNLRASIDRRGYRTETDYDALNRPVAQREFEGSVQRYTQTTAYDDTLRTVTHTDRRGIDTVVTKDGLGRTVQTTRADATEQSSYDGLNNVVTQTDANNHVTKVVYDGANRMSQKTLGFGTVDAATTTFTYDLVGNLLTAKTGRVTDSPFDVRETYDALNRSVRTEDANGHVTTRAFDAAGNKVCEKRPLGGSDIAFNGAGALSISDIVSTVCTGEYVTKYQYDEENRLIGSTDADAGRNTFVYDVNRNLVARQDALARLTLYTYDGLNRRTGEHQFLSTWPRLPVNARSALPEPAGMNVLSRVTTYDQSGNPQTFTDPNGNVTTNTYGIANRLELQEFVAGLNQNAPAIPSIDYAYDGSSNVTEIVEHRTSDEVHTVRIFDDLNRLKSESRGSDRTVSYEYDAKGNRKTVSGPGGDTTYTYDALDRIKTATVLGSTATYSYYPDSLLKDRHGAGFDETRTYDAAGQLLSITNDASTFAYTYDANGNRATQTERRTDPVTQLLGGTEATTYSYDHLDRLTHVADASGGTVTYGYDAVGNRTSEVETNSGTTTHNIIRTFDASDRMWSQVDSVGDKSADYDYDPNGNVISKTTATTTRTFVWDVVNTLTSVSEGGIEKGRYEYAAGGMRVKRQAAGESVEYVLDDMFVLAELDGASAGTSVLRRNHYAHEPLAVTGVGGTSFLATDALGSVTDRVSASGSVQKAHRYDAWGNYKAGTAPTAYESKLGFTGHQYDPETGLIYARARYYDTENGVFLSRDTHEGEIGDAPSLHRYVYVANNPLIYTDPLGLEIRTAKDYLRILFLGQDHWEESDFQDYNNNPAAHNAGFAAAFIGSGAAAVTLGLTLAPALVTLGSGVAELPAVTAFINSPVGAAAAATVGAGEGLLVAHAVVDTTRDIGTVMSSTANEADRVGAGIRLGTNILTLGLGKAATMSRAVEEAVAIESRGASAELRATSSASKVASAEENLVRAERRVGQEAAEVSAKAESTVAEAGAACGPGGCSGPGTCFVAGTTVEMADGEKPIESIQIGDRVTSANQACAENKIDKSWLIYSLRMPNPDAPLDIIEIELARPSAWFEHRSFEVGKRVWLDLDELKLAGFADVKSVRAATSGGSAGREGCLVLSTIRHVARSTLVIEFEENSDRVELTPVHRLYSVKRGWTRADSLLVGEKLKTHSGEITIKSISRGAADQKVFNIEVDVEHTYYVQASGVWSHNQCANPTAAFGPSETLAEFGMGGGEAPSMFGQTWHVPEAAKVGPSAVPITDPRRLLMPPKPVTIEFPTKGLSAARRALFDAHLAEQELALNGIHPADLKLNLSNYNYAKESGLLDRSRDLAGSFLGPRPFPGAHAAHALDARAGGYLFDFVGWRDPIQSRIGSLWRTRWKQIVPGEVHKLVPVHQ